MFLIPKLIALKAKNNARCGRGSHLRALYCTLSERLCFGHFSSALDRGMCGFALRNTLCNIWRDYLQLLWLSERLRSLPAMDASICQLWNTLIKLIAFVLLIKLLNCAIWNRKHILEGFSGTTAGFSVSSVRGIDPTAKQMIQPSTALSTVRHKGMGRFEPGLFNVPRHHLLCSLSATVSIWDAGSFKQWIWLSMHLLSIVNGSN